MATERVKGKKMVERIVDLKEVAPCGMHIKYTVDNDTDFVTYTDINGKGYLRESCKHCSWRSICQPVPSTEKVFTIEKLIERMKAEGFNTGVLEMWYNDLKRNIEHCSQLHDNGLCYIDSYSYKRANELYEDLHGFLYALDTVNCINTELLEKCNDELMNLFDF